MKTVISFAVALFTLLTAQIASAYYCPSTGRWLSRDPIAEPGFQSLQLASQTSIKPTPQPSSDRWIVRDSIRDRGFNCCLFANNNALNYFDPLGLDIWVIRDKSGLIRHREAIGNNSDGTFWSSDFGPTSTSLVGRLNCQGRINFTPNQLVLIPTNLPPDYVIESHTIVGQIATDAAMDYAKQRADNADQPRYDACGNNCIDWANGLANYATGRQLREDLDKIKNDKSQPKQ